MQKLLSERNVTPFSKFNFEEQNDAWHRLGASLVATSMANIDRLRQKKVPLPFDRTIMIKAFADTAKGMMSSPRAVLDYQVKSMRAWADFSMHLADQIFGTSQATSTSFSKPDRRFRDADWDENLFFKSVKEAYLLASNQMIEFANDVLDLDKESKTRLDFLVRQFVDATSPANFASSNPEVIRETVERGGVNLIGGLANALSDLAQEDAWVRREPSKIFAMGEEIAATPGSVVYQNEIMQLIQYSPATEDVFERPLLYVPPLVNRYYLLDLKPASSMFKWLIEQGHTLFTISWVNPQKEQHGFDFEDYVVDGVLEAVDVVQKITGSKKTDLFSFCMGGAITAAALGYLQSQGKLGKISSATLMATLIDNSELGEWGTFVTKDQVEAFNTHVEHEGLISGNELKKLFSAVRSNDLIWSSVIDHYLMDRKAPASDLLQWFGHGSNIPATFASTWSRDVLSGNKLTQPNALKVNGVSIDLGKVKTPIFNLALKDDHVAGWKAVHRTGSIFGGPVDFVLGGSGHNAGIVNPPSRNKHGYWLNDDVAEDAEAWLSEADRNEGSWWPVWQSWLTTGKRKQNRIPAKEVGSDEFAALEMAPGSYARM